MNQSEKEHIEQGHQFKPSATCPVCIHGSKVTNCHVEPVMSSVLNKFWVDSQRIFNNLDPEKHNA